MSSLPSSPYSSVTQSNNSIKSITSTAAPLTTSTMSSSSTAQATVTEASPVPTTNVDPTRFMTQLLSTIQQHRSQTSDTVSSSRHSVSPPSPPSALHGSTKRKAPDTREDLDFGITSASKVVLPSDPVRRASIINMATAAAAAVLGGQQVQRRISMHLEQQQKRQRTRIAHLGFLAQQARLRSGGSIRFETVRKAQQTTTGIQTTQAPIFTPLTKLVDQVTPPAAIFFKPTVPGGMNTDPSTSHTHVASPSLSSSDILSPSLDDSTETHRSIGLPVTSASLQHQRQQEWEATVKSEGFLQEAKVVVNQYGRFYQLEKKWAEHALELEKRRNSDRGVRREPMVQCDLRRTSEPVFSQSKTEKNPGDCLAKSGHRVVAQSTFSSKFEDETQPPHHFNSPMLSSHGSMYSSPKQQLPLLRSRAVSPTSIEHTSSESRPTPKTAANAGGLANLISNFSELIEERQKVCSGLEALADQAKQLPIKRFSQPTTKAVVLPPSSFSDDSSWTEMDSSVFSEDTEEEEEEEEEEEKKEKKKKKKKRNDDQK